MKALSPALIFAGLAAVSGVVHGDIYKHIDEDGNVTYGEIPANGATKVELSKTNLIDNSTLTGETGSQRQIPERYTEASQVDSAVVIYKSLKVASPENDQITDGLSGAVTVSFQPEPGLGPNDQLVITVNGEDVSEGSNTSHALQQLPRGAYNVSGRILDSNGRVKIRSEAVTFHVRRPSILFGNSNSVAVDEE